MAELVIELLRFIAAQMDQLDPKLSSAIMGVVVLVMVLYTWGPWPSRPPPTNQKLPGGQDHLDDMQSLRAEVDRLTSIIETREKQGPSFAPLEHIYFNTNGITNAVFVLIAALLIFEYATLADRVRVMLNNVSVPPAQKALATNMTDKVIQGIEAEVGLLMAILAGTVVICSLLVAIGRIRTGRSFEIINRSFQLSLLVAVVTFAAFALPLSFPVK